MEERHLELGLRAWDAAVRKKSRSECAESLASAFAEFEREVLEQAARVLMDKVKRHRDEQAELGLTQRCSEPGTFCEDYGCGTLVSLADDIRALRASRPDAGEGEER